MEPGVVDPEVVRDLAAAMSGYSDEELAVVRRFLLDMTEAIERHSRPGTS